MNRTNSFLFLIALTALAASSLGETSTSVINVREHGATGDGSTNDTPAIQHCIDQCSAQGGGEVLLPAGNYLSGTIRLKNDVTLHLNQGAALIGSTAAADYQNHDSFTDGNGHSMGYALVTAVDAKNVSIAGPGTIDGRGKEVAASQKRNGGYKIRPFLLRFVRCENVGVKTERKGSGKHS